MCHLHENIRKDSKTCVEMTVLEKSIVHISCESQKGEPFRLNLPGQLHQLLFPFSASYKGFVKVFPRFSELFHSRFESSSRLGEGPVELGCTID